MNPPNIDVFMVDTPQAWQDLRDLVRDSKYQFISLDLETDSRVEKKAKIFGIGLCFEDNTAFYIPIRKNTGEAWWDDATLASIYEWVTIWCKAFKLIGWNLIYDVLVWEYNTGKDISQDIYCDGILAKHAVDEERPFGLKEVGTRYLGPWADKAQKAMLDDIKANGGKTTKDDLEMWRCSTDILGEYCGWDTVLAWKLTHLFLGKLKSEGMEKLFFDEETMPLYRLVTIPMKRHGFPVDVGYFKGLKSRIEKDILALEDGIIDIIRGDVEPFVTRVLSENYPMKRSGSFPKYAAEELGSPLPTNKLGAVTLAKKFVEQAAMDYPGPYYAWLLGHLELSPQQVRSVQERWFHADEPSRRHVFNLKSNEHLGWLLFEKLGEEPASRTETGKPQIDEDYLETLREKYPWVGMLVDYKKLNKLSSTYVDGILDRQVDGVLYSSMLQFGTTSGRYSSANPNCLSTDTQILTRTGFKFHHELTADSEVASYDGHNIMWQKPLAIYKSQVERRSMVAVKNVHMDMLLTGDHRVVYEDRKSGKLLIKPASKFPKDARILHGAELLDEVESGDLAWLRFVVAAQADSEIRRDSRRVRFVFSKKRKYQRLLDIISNISGISFEDKSADGRFEVLVDGVKSRLLEEIGYEKTFPPRWVSMPKIQRECFLEELFHWDGLSTRKNNYSSNNESNVDLVQALCALSGWRAHKRAYYSKSATAPNYQVDITRRDFSATANTKVSSFVDTCEVWCVSVSTGMILVRRGSDTFITGNCQNIPRVKEDDSGLSPMVLEYGNAIKAGFIPPKGYKLVNADYSALEPRCFAHVSGDDTLRNVFRRGLDLYSQIAIDVFGLSGCSSNPSDKNYLKKLHPEKRQLAKIFSLAVVYGAEASRIAQSMGIDYKQAESIIQAYLEAYPELRRYMMRCDYSVKKHGSVKSDFGRVRHLSAAKELYARHGDRLLDRRWANANGLGEVRYKLKNALNLGKNHPIQSLAAHIVNRAMIRFSQLLQEHNIDGWISMQVHDEITANIRADQAELAASLMKDAMENTIKISIPLIAEPMVGMNWAAVK